MAIIKQTCYICVCNKCKHRWQPRGDYKDLRQIKKSVKICPKCKVVTWNN